MLKCNQTIGAFFRTFRSSGKAKSFAFGLPLTSNVEAVEKVQKRYACHFQAKGINDVRRSKIRKTTFSTA